MSQTANMDGSDSNLHAKPLIWLRSIAAKQENPDNQPRLPELHIWLPRPRPSQIAFSGKAQRQVHTAQEAGRPWGSKTSPGIQCFAELVG
jgi:hypothetical protein